MSEANTNQQCLQSPHLEWRDGLPFSSRFGDVYFSLASGLDETHYVFLQQNQLHQRFSNLQQAHFTIAETGFGTGLNFLSAWRLWNECAPDAASLHFVSTELFPLSLQDMAQALALWPELAAFAEKLLEQYRNLMPGFNHLSFGNIRLTLLIGDARDMLPQLTGRVDAWFLDGFAPARNPDMWDGRLFGEIARLSHSTTTFATFTSAAAVRRGLIAARFEVEKIKGFASKREMLRGRYSAKTASPPAAAPLVSERSAIVIGGGIAGASTAFSIAQRGFGVTLIERHAHLAAEASGNPQAVLYPRLSGHDIALSRIATYGFLYTISLLKQLLPQGQDWSQCGLLQLGFNAREAKRCQEILARGLPFVQQVNAEQASAIAGIALSDGGMYFAQGGWLHPPALCAALAAHPNIRTLTATQALHLRQDNDRWQVSGASGLIAEATVVVVAAANDCMQFLPHLPLQPVRGQVTLMPASVISNRLNAVVCTEGYLAPARNGLHSLGATFSKDNTALDVRDADHAYNLAMLRQMSLQLQPDAAALAGRSALRCSTPDYLPLAGMMLDAGKMQAIPAHLATQTGLPWLEGLYVNTGHGSKGMVTAPLCGEIIAAAINHEIMPVDYGLLRALDPNRFLLRAQGLKKLTGSRFS